MDGAPSSGFNIETQRFIAIVCAQLRVRNLAKVCKAYSYDPFQGLKHLMQSINDWRDVYMKSADPK